MLNLLALSPGWLIGVLLAGMLASFVLMPRGPELAQLLARSGRTEDARDVLQRQLAGGEQGAGTIAALATVHADRKEYDQAIDLMERLVRQRPDDLPALQSLADYYRAGNRPSELLTALERLQRLAPTADRQRELLDLLGEKAAPRLRIDALSELVLRFEAGTVVEHLALARLASMHGQHALVLDVLKHMTAQFPESLDASVVAAQMCSLAALEQGSHALAHGGAWLASRPAQAAREAPVLAGALNGCGRAAMAATFAAAHMRGPAAGPELQAVWAQATVDTGRPEEAFSYLERLPDAYRSPRLLQMRIALALDYRRFDLAATDAKALGLDRLPYDLVVRLATAAVAERRRDVLDLLRRHSETAIGSNNPVLAAQVAMVAEDRAAAARWVEVALQAPAHDPLDKVRLAGVLAQVPQPAKALALLNQVRLDQLDGGWLGEAARLYAGLGHAEVAYPALDALRHARPSRDADEAWAVAAIVARQYDAVAQWLATNPPSMGSADFVRDIAYRAFNAKAFELAAAAAEHLNRVQPSAQNRLLMAHSLLRAGKVREALPWLRGTAGDRDAEESYVFALQDALRMGAPVKDELRAFYVQRLRHGRRPERRVSDVESLLALGGPADVLGLLEPLVLEDPGRWLGRFEELAVQTSQRPRLVALWTRLAAAEATGTVLREQIAFRLLEAGHKAPAERAFRALAGQAGPDDPALRRLLFVWGPRPNAEQLDWLEARARRATARDAAAWMAHLAQRGAPDRAVALYVLADRSDDKAAFDAFLAALPALGDKAAAVAAVRQAAERTRAPEMHSALARQAAQLGDPQLERRLREQSVASGSADPADVRTLAMEAYRARDAAAAERWLKALHALGAGDHETFRLLGELQHKRGDVADARQSLELAVNDLDAKGMAATGAMAAKANLLHRLGRLREAAKLYEQLLAQQPRDNHLLADYATLLLDAGEIDRAQQLLGTR